jgi:acetyl esterase/lipase
MHGTQHRTTLSLSLVLVVIGSALALGIQAGASTSPATVHEFAVLPPIVIRDGLHAGGTIVRQQDGLTVRRVDTSPRAARLLAAGMEVYRVSIAGSYRPRPLRYVIRAGGTPVAYGIPRGDERALLGVTSDPRVLTDRITVRYGSDRAAGSPRPPATSPAPVGSGRLPASGPFDVTRTEYDFGNRAFQPAGLPGRVELRADVHYPTDLSSGPYPMVLFLHGNHSSCYKGNRARYEWPCRKGWTPIPNEEGYDYIARRLASHGFIVVSVSGNGVNVLGNYVEDTGMRQRGLLLEKHLDLWQNWNTVGGDPFGDLFLGAVDMSRIGVMGHSRGGEGAVWNVVVDRERPSPYGIDAVLPLAPVDFDRITVNDVALGVILPYCDGDVYDLQGVHYFDDARYLEPGDATPKATVTVFGANHNFFNTVWSPSSGIPGAFNDAYRCPGGQLTEIQQRRVGIAYVASFFRRYVGGAANQGPIWTGEVTPPMIAPATTAVTYLAPDTPATRLDVDRFTDPGDLRTNQLGGAVTPTDMGIVGWCSNVFDTPCVPGFFSYFDIHLSYSFFGPVPGPGLQEGILGWSDSADGKAGVRFAIPFGDRDVGGFDHLVFRTVPNPGYMTNDGVDYQDFDLVLEDTTGARSVVAASDVGNDVLAYPLQRRGGGHVIMNQIRFPLTAFTGVDLTKLKAVEIDFSRTSRGVIDISDMAFERGEL